MTKLLLFVITILSSLVTFGQVQTKQFEIIGDVSGFQDSTYIKLYDFSTGSNVLMDSAQIVKNKFVFKGLINNDYQKLGLIYRNKTNSGYKSDIRVFWVESGTMHFTAKKGGFYNAEITGSPMQSEADLLKAMVDKNPDKENEIYITYIKEHPNSLISGEKLGVFCRKWGRDTTQLLYNRFSKKIKDSQFGKSIHSYLSLNKHIKIGDKFVDFTMPNLKGENVSLSGYKNKYILLDFWGSWCSPCREENPKLVKTYQEFRNKGFEILGVSVETNKESWAAAVKTDHITWESISDLKGENNAAVLIYGISYYPANFLIDPNGTIIAKDLRGDALRSKLSEILNK